MNTTDAGIVTIPTDVVDEASVLNAFSEIQKYFREIDILIDNADIGFVTDLTQCALEDYRKIVETKLTGVFLCCRAALPTMKARKQGYIINVSSEAGKASNPVAPIYCASKHGLNGDHSALTDNPTQWDIRDQETANFTNPRLPPTKKERNCSPFGVSAL